MQEGRRVLYIQSNNVFANFYYFYTLGDVSPDGMEVDTRATPPTTSNINSDSQTAGQALADFLLALDDYVPTVSIISVYLDI